MDYNDSIRRSQLIVPFGIGAMVDFPEDTLILVESYGRRCQEIVPGGVVAPLQGGGVWLVRAVDDNT